MDLTCLTRWNYARRLPGAGLLLLLLIVWLIPASGSPRAQSASGGRVFHAAPHGAPGNDGSEARPLALATALSRTSPLRPGDTLWLRGGTYCGPFTSYLAGTSAAPIVIRQYPGERATLDGCSSPSDVLTVHGEWVVFWGFELTNSDPRRRSQQPGPWPYDLYRGTGITSRGANIKYINLVLNNLREGIGLWSDSVNSEVYGSLLYHNGWQGPDRSHGHGIYTQNEAGLRLLRENILFNQFSHGIQAYGSSAATLDNITLEGNVAFNNGILGFSGFERDLLLGGGRVAQNPVMRENFTYGGGQSNLGYAAGCANGLVTGNYFVGSSPLVLAFCTPAMTGNVLYSPLAAQYGGYGTFPQQYPANTYHLHRPADLVVRVRPNQYEPGRAHVIIYNWPNHQHVPVDLRGSGLAIGDAFEIRDGQNFYGGAVVTGTYDGSPVVLPMTGLSLELPVGDVPVLPKHTAPEFGVFVVLKRSTAAPVEPVQMVQAPALTPSGGTFTGPVTVSIATATAGATIRFTTDGTMPSASSPVYTGPQVVDRSLTVNARAFKAGMHDSAVSTAVFTINAPPPPAPTPDPVPDPAPDPTPTPTPPPGGVVSISLEAESGTVVAPMTAATHDGASGRRYLGNSTDRAGTVTLQFTAPAAGTYVVWTRVMSYTSNSLFVSVDGGEERLFQVPVLPWGSGGSTWRWVPVKLGDTVATAQPLVMTLSAGTHTLRFRTGQAVTRLDAVLITNDPNHVP